MSTAVFVMFSEKFDLYKNNKNTSPVELIFLVLQAISLEYAVLLHMERKGLESYLNVQKKI
jgi:hypothetical protein